MRRSRVVQKHRSESKRDPDILSRRYLHKYGSHFEFCVFVDKEMPLMFAYFDSHNDTISTSMAKRELSPSYYLDNGYEVTKILKTPTSAPTIIPETQKPDSGYAFVSDPQRKQIKSTILLRPNVSVPCALVITSNIRNAFEESNLELQEFISAVAELVLYDLLADNFINRIRVLKPNLLGAT